LRRRVQAAPAVSALLRLDLPRSGPSENRL
jgi:hypothetical protein